MCLKAMSTVTWVLDGNGNYEVSSAAHLKQLMHKGTLSTDVGTAPSTYWDSNYIQTADIDLLGDTTDIVTIGVTAHRFTGEYDGNTFSISNWSYLDPEFYTSSNCQFAVGLFGEIEEPSVLKNIRMTGICTIHGYKQNAGFVVGLSLYNGHVDVSNIECDLSPGSHMTRSNMILTRAAGAVGVIGGILHVPRLVVESLDIAMTVSITIQNSKHRDFRHPL